MVANMKIILSAIRLNSHLLPLVHCSLLYCLVLVHCWTGVPGRVRGLPFQADLNQPQLWIPRVLRVSYGNGLL